MSLSGRVFLVGAGPGDPGLLTLRARELIESCDVLVFDYLVNPVIHGWASDDCEQIDVGKSPGLKKSAEQAQIEELLVDRAKQGKRVVRLKGGDPFIFGRGGEEIEALNEAGIPFEIVPGVTASLGAAAYTGIPLTHRGISSSVTLVTGHEAPNKEGLRVDFAAISRQGGSLAVYMGVSTLPRIVEQLLEGDCCPETPVAVVEWATYSRQRKVIGNLGDIVAKVEDAAIKSPAMIIIGDVVKCHDTYNWFKTGALSGQRIVITRARDQASELRLKLESLGAEVLEIPMIQTEPAILKQDLTEVFAEIATYEWIVFTSPNGVRYFFELFLRAFKDIRSFGGMRVACIGEATAKELEPYHIAVDLIAPKAVAESLAEALIATDSLDSANVLVVTGNRNRDTLVTELEQNGRAIVDKLQVYTTNLAKVADSAAAQSFREKGADYVVFSSSSTAQAWSQLSDQLQVSEGVKAPRFVSIGSVTSKALSNNNLPVDIQAERANLDSLIDAIIEDTDDHE
ncbi:MAG: uroporphyrinogen-III C-methyltransferase [Opitutales bacterium]